jgi:hypothetical protein
LLAAFKVLREAQWRPQVVPFEMLELAEVIPGGGFMVVVGRPILPFEEVALGDVGRPVPFVVVV